MFYRPSWALQKNIRSATAKDVNLALTLPVDIRGMKAPNTLLNTSLCFVSEQKNGFPDHLSKDFR